MDFLCFIIVGTGVLDGPFPSKSYFVTARTTTTSLALRSKFAKANIVVAPTDESILFRNPKNTDRFGLKNHFHILGIARGVLTFPGVYGNI